MKLADEGKIDLTAAGSAGGESLVKIHAALSETGRRIVAEVASETGANKTEFCRDSGSGITNTVTDIAIRLVEDSVIDESEAYNSESELTTYYIAFCANRRIIAGVQ